MRKVGSDILNRREVESDILKKRKVGSDILNRRKVGSDILNKRKVVSYILNKRKVGSDILNKRKVGSYILNKRKVGSYILNRRKVGSIKPDKGLLNQRRWGLQNSVVENMKLTFLIICLCLHINKILHTKCHIIFSTCEKNPTKYMYIIVWTFQYVYVL